MPRLPRGVKLTNPRTEGDSVVYALTVSRWRMALIVLSILRRGFRAEEV